MDTIDLSTLKSQVCFSPARLQKMQADLEKMLNRAVEDLKMQLRRAQGSGNRRGVFDTLKNWWSNIRHGYKNPQNPYFHQNTLGHLGRPVKEMSLHEYKYLVEKSNRLENTMSLTEGKLQLDLELDNWLSDIKNDISNYFSAQIQRAATKTAAKNAPKKVAPPEKFPLVGGDIKKSFFGSKSQQPDDLLGLPPEDTLFDKETTTVDDKDKAVTTTDTSVAVEPAATGNTDASVSPSTPVSPEALQATQDRIINFTGPKKRKAGGKGKGKNNLQQKIDTPVINPLEPEKAEPIIPAQQQKVEPVIPAQTLQPLPFPIKKRRPGVGANFFESNQNLKLKGLTLYEKTLVCLDKLRLNS
jgi:hypothetical protein